MSRPNRVRDDDGFALLFVMLVITLVMAGVGTAIAVATPAIARSKASQDDGTALIAAQSGVDDVIAWLDGIPACRSLTRICAQALGASTTALAANGKSRPTDLGNGASFSWSTGATTTAAGYLRVDSTGMHDGVTRSLTADLSLNPSILSYGYYTDYETQAPSFFDSYFIPRSVYITNSSVYSKVSNAPSGSAVPVTAAWNGAPSGASLGYPDTVCGQHWWYESSSSPGRAQAGSTWYESGKLNWIQNGSAKSSTVYHGSTCDLVFTSGMTEDGPTYTRDALLISSGSGSGPSFLQPVSTLWGYPGHNSPAVSSQPWRMNDSNANLASSKYKPQVAAGDLTLPPNVGKDGLADNSCVYTGPTRVVLNGDGTATITSPDTTTKNSGSDAACYPTVIGSAGVIGWMVNYKTTGSGIIYAKNLKTPSSGWPQSNLVAGATPSANNEIFYLPVTGTATADPSTSAAPSTCSSSATYSATVSSGCSWTNVASTTDGGSGNGWTSYTTSGTSTYCSTPPQATDRLLFECEYSGTTTKARPSTDQYASARSALQTKINGGACSSGTSAAQASCLVTTVNSQLAKANTGQHAANYATPANNDHQYVATTSVGTASTGTAQDVGSLPNNPTTTDDFFTFSGQKARETPTLTPITVTVSRQVYNSSQKKWTPSVPQFSFTVTHTDWKVTQQPSGASYFPNPQDVTTYDIGATSSGAVAGQNGSSQPGDLYVEGKNSGELSLIADNDVEVTGNITKDQDDSSAASPLSLTAGQDVRNYHPVSCVDQNATDIAKTSAGWCPNDITGLSSSSTSAAQYTNLDGTGDRIVDAAVFTLTGSLRTDNYDRGAFVGNLTVNGGIYQSHRGANGVQFGDGGHSGTSLQYHYVDLTRANLPYIPPASDSTNPRPWDVVSISSG